MNKENKSTSITFRLTEQDKLLLSFAAYKFGLPMSKYVRLLIDQSINSIKADIQRGEFTIEDIKILLDNFVQH